MIYEHDIEERKRKPKRVGVPYPKLRPEYWKHMREYLAERELDFDNAQYNGWYPTCYDYIPRIVIPCTNTTNHLYWQARAMNEVVTKRYDSPNVSRGDSVVTCYPSSVASGSVICEGPMDALAASSVGYHAIAVMGNQPPVTVFNHIVRLLTGVQHRILVVPDLDTLDFASSVLSVLASVNLRARIVLPAQKDLAGVSAKLRKKFLDEG